MQPGASLREIKTRYYLLCKQLHPDVSASKTDDRVKNQFRTVVDAYELLSDPRRRSMYDLHKVGWGNASMRSPYASATGPYTGRPRSTPWGRGPDFDARFRYGYRTAAAGAPTASEMRVPNIRFAVAMAGLCTVGGVSVYLMIDSYTTAKYERFHVAAIQSLERARTEAFSGEGQQRMQQLRQRARELKDQRRAQRGADMPEQESFASVPADEPGYSLPVDETAISDTAVAMTDGGPHEPEAQPDQWDVLPPARKFRVHPASPLVKELD